MQSSVPRRLLAGLIATAATLACSATAPSVEPQPQRSGGYQRPANLHDGWKVTTPGDVGLDSLPLIEMALAIESGRFSGIHSVLVARRGALVFEKYFDGPDARLDGAPTTSAFGPDTLHDARSVSKSITALLLGIAIERRLVAGVHSRVSDYFPGLAADEQRRAMTVEHLLTMTSGVADDERETGVAEILASSDPIAWTLAQPLVAAPGAHFEYAGGNTTLLRGIIERASGKPLDDFAEAVLFDPLGIRTYEWMRWVDGSPRSAGGLRLRPRDMAKIGALMAGEGRWRGRQIVPRQWVRQTAVVRAKNEEDEQYGYHWWIQDYASRGRHHRAVVALGSGGQRILAFDALDLVVVFTGGNYEDMASARLPEVLMATYVLRAVRDTPRLHVAAPPGWADVGGQPMPPEP